ncbi:uncharacterized protein EV422DRAFT_616902 [Fimicolochytrium jonesii]|uniref:uncharacterized protein n=1 Tax=Fimicolochytrium jonesii TaxID=1396493 RepID=UPI0022FE22B0|nr:uncharacterized protein EV422DRAFT_616902 [Fimicolochytrium jonesii]KAI8825862.1 hypothetical protein EV422DRAFT_616902 [Fimicolochytrium jonesii]
MSFSWNDIDERQRARNEKDRELKDYLRAQQQEQKERKVRQKQNDIDSFHKAYGFGVRQNPQSNGPEQPALAPRAEPDSEREQHSKHTIPPKSPLPPISTHPPDFSSAYASRAEGSPRTTSLVLKTNDEIGQLQNERRLRMSLESDLQAGKSVIASLSAKVDAFANLLSAAQGAAHNAGRIAADADRRARDVEAAVASKLEHIMTSSVRGLVDQYSSQHDRQDTILRHEESDRYRAVMEQMARLRYQVEALQVQTTEQGQNLRFRALDLHQESQIGIDAMRLAKAHDAAIDEVHNVVNARMNSVEQKMIAAAQDLERRIENEARLRDQAASAMFSEMRKLISESEYNSAASLESMRTSIVHANEADRADWEKAVSHGISLTRAVEKDVAAAVGGVTDLGLRVEAGFQESRTGQKEMSAQFQSTIAQTIERLEGMVNAQASYSLAELGYLKARMAPLEEASRLNHQQIDAAEKVLRAEINQRLHFSTDTSKAFTSLHSQISKLDDQLQKKLQEQAEAASQSVYDVKTRILQDVEAQLGSINAHCRTVDKAIAQNTESVGRQLASLQTTAEQLRDGAEVRDTALRGEMEQLNAETLKKASAAAAEVAEEMREKIRVKTLQLDRTFEALKQELAARTTRSAIEDVVSRQVEKGMSALQSSFNEKFAAQDKAQSCFEAELKQVQAHHTTSTENANKLHKQLASLSDRARQLEQTQQAASNKADSLHVSMVGMQKRELEVINHLADLQNSIAALPTHSSLQEMERLIAMRMDALQSRILQKTDDRMAARTEDSRREWDDNLRAFSTRMNTSVSGAIHSLQNEFEEERRNTLVRVTATAQTLIEPLIRERTRHVNDALEMTFERLRDVEGSVRDKTRELSARCDELKAAMNRRERSQTSLDPPQLYRQPPSRTVKEDKSSLTKETHSEIKQPGGHSQGISGRPEVDEPIDEVSRREENVHSIRQTVHDHLPVHPNQQETTTEAKEAPSQNLSHATSDIPSRREENVHTIRATVEEHLPINSNKETKESTQYSVTQATQEEKLKRNHSQTRPNSGDAAGHWGTSPYHTVTESSISTSNVSPEAGIASHVPPIPSEPPATDMHPSSTLTAPPTVKAVLAIKATTREQHGLARSSHNIDAASSRSKDEETRASRRKSK